MAGADSGSSLNAEWQMTDDIWHPPFVIRHSQLIEELRIRVLGTGAGIACDAQPTGVWRIAPTAPAEQPYRFPPEGSNMYKTYNAYMRTLHNDYHSASFRFTYSRADPPIFRVFVNQLRNSHDTWEWERLPPGGSPCRTRPLVSKFSRAATKILEATAGLAWRKCRSSAPPALS